ncbi:hypothetical protein CRG98_024287 [Punica granatum]|uniref:Uncharacterized protein n=1 Tax=Punica granatum TaxID=22663 RepID=A0A2I0JG74_PUNGR|nr:hypothetical protein CRG98_024287 [Punica granatum]
MFSLIDLNAPAKDTISNLPRIDQPDHGMQLVKLTPETAIIPHQLPVCSPAFEHGKGILDELENIEEGFFAKFLCSNGVSPKNPEQLGAILSNPKPQQPGALLLSYPTENPGSSKASGALKTTEYTSGMSVIPGMGIIVPPGSNKAAQLEKLLRIYLEYPKHAKGTVMAWLSALRAREKKKRMKNSMLQQEINTSKAESYVLSAQLKRAQANKSAHYWEMTGRNTNDIKLESTEGKSPMIQLQIQLLDNLNKELSDEIKYLRSLTGPALPSSPKNALIGVPKLPIQTADSQHKETKGFQELHVKRDSDMARNRMLPLK